MASEPQPSGPTTTDADPDAPSLPTNAEDRKTATALSSLTKTEDDDAKPAGKDVDAAALGAAMERLEVSAGGAGKAGATSGAKDTAEKAAGLKKIKLDKGDVAILVSSNASCVVLEWIGEWRQV